jgi:hypothetical protein
MYQSLVLVGLGTAAPEQLRLLDEVLVPRVALTAERVDAVEVVLRVGRKGRREEGRIEALLRELLVKKVGDSLNLQIASPEQDGRQLDFIDA